MNQTLGIIRNRRSVRAFTGEPVTTEERETILSASFRAPTAGNMMLYTIIEVTKQETKERLAETCDNQPFIAKAPLVLLFLADYQRWFDYFNHCDVEGLARGTGMPLRRPGEGDLMLAVCDALIAAQTAVIAAESLGLGSCYIGDIMENYEIHRDLFGLPVYAFPITLVCFGRPSKEAALRELTGRFDSRFILFQDSYRRLSGEDFAAMFAPFEREHFRDAPGMEEAGNVGRYMYRKKFVSAFSLEMGRSVRAVLENWRG